VSRVNTRRIVTGIQAVLLAATVAVAGQQRGGQRPTQNQPRDDQKADSRGGSPSGPQRFKWWQDERTKAELRLAPEQSTRIEEIFQSHFTKMKDVVDDLNRREEQLSNLISANDVTESELLKQADQVEALRGSLSKARTLMLFRIRRVLSAEQRTKLVDILKAQERERRPGRAPDRHPAER
jgi:Spy/CpxP family protein refolding chaperone